MNFGKEETLPPNVQGCLAKVKIPNPETKKISSKTRGTVFVGYSLDNNIRRFFVINLYVSRIARNTIIKALDSVFFKNIFPLKSIVCSNPFIYLASDSFSILVLDPMEEPRRNKRRRVEKNLGDDFVTFMIEDTSTTQHQAMASINSIFQKEAIDDEYNSIMSNNTQILTSLPHGNKPLGYK